MRFDQLALDRPPPKSHVSLLRTARGSSQGQKAPSSKSETTRMLSPPTGLGICRASSSSGVKT